MKSTFVLTTLCLLQLVSEVGYSASIKTEVTARPVIQKALAPEAITISDDGNQITFIAKSLNELSSAPPTSAWRTHKTADGWSEPQQIPLKGMVTSIAFGHQDQWIVVTSSRGTVTGYKKILSNLFSDREKIGDLEGFDHRIEILDSKDTSKVLYTLTAKDLGLQKSEMLKHARISPNGKWLTFYTHGFEEQRGVHVYNFETRKAASLGPYDDKHPTWTPDGTKILFHQQTGGNSFTKPGEEERSLIGYYEMDFSGSDVKSTRVMMDTEVKGFAYQKHPSVYPGTDLLFFHGADSLDSAKRLHIRRLKPNSKIYKLSDLMTDDVEIKSSKHANSSINPTGIYFVGKKKGAAETEIRNKSTSADFETLVQVQDMKDIFWISDIEVQKINKQVGY
jgi:hypothetical protein